MGKPKVFAGNSNPELATSICDSLGIRLGNSLCKKFSNDESWVEIRESVRDSDVYIIQSGCGEVNDSLMELLIMIKSCKHASAESVTAVIPLFPYSRFDGKSHSKKATNPISAKLVANMLSAAGADRIMTIDLHASQIQGFFDMPVDNLHAESAIIRWIWANIPDWQKSVIVAPCEESAKRATSLADRLKVEFAILVPKVTRARSSTTSEASERVLVGEVKDRLCIVINDVADACVHFVAAVDNLLEHFGASKVYAVATHGIFTGKLAPELFASNVEAIVVTNSIPQAKHQELCPKIQVIDIAPIIAEAIRRTHNNESVSFLFSHVPEC